jgi:hypothetical protein
MFNPFEDFEALGGQSGPCRTIKITKEMRRLEALKQQQQPVTEWSAFKATLSESNLRLLKVKRVDPVLHIQENTHRVQPSGRRVRLSEKKCVCGKYLSRGAAGVLCSPCLIVDRKKKAKFVRSPKKGPGVKCEFCPNTLRAGRVGLCHTCKWKSGRKHDAPVAAVKKGGL